MPLSLVYESEYEFQFHAEQYIYQMYNRGKTYEKKTNQKKQYISRWSERFYTINAQILAKDVRLCVATRFYILSADLCIFVHHY